MLQWLIANNYYYESIVINRDLVSTLPDDGSLAHIQTVIVSIEISSETEFPDHDIVDSHNATLSRTFIPGLYRTLNEHQAIQQSLQQSCPTLKWHHTAQSPINK